MFRHNKIENDHHHVYLFSLPRTEQAIRKYIGHYYSKEKFSVKKTCGGNARLPITVEGAYQYGTEDTLTDPVYLKGFTQDHLDMLKLRAEAYYKPVSERKMEHGDTIVVTREIHHERQDKVWNRLVDNIEKYKDKHIWQIKSMISAEWLNSGKALPRQCDLHRYAVSIYWRLKYESVEVPDDALESLYRIS